MLGKKIKLEIHFRTCHDRFKTSDFMGVGDDPESEGIAVKFSYRKADAVYADGTFVDHEVRQFLW